MSETSAQEPTMEEILASIRRIISEDDAPAEAAPAPEPATHQAAPEPEDEDVLELTERVDEPVHSAPPVESVGDLDIYTPSADFDPTPPPAPAETYAPPPAYTPTTRDEPLVGRDAAMSAASSFSRLTSSILMPRDGRTLEDVTRELLMPLLKGWLDDNLPRIVQAKVDEEVERIARGRVD